jgi:hypothetical protein
MKKIWWLIGILVLLLLVSGFREGLEMQTQCPPGSIEVKRFDNPPRISCKKEVGQAKCPEGQTLTPASLIEEGIYGRGDCMKDDALTGDIPKCPGNATIDQTNNKQMCVEVDIVSIPQTPQATTTGTSTGGSSTSSLGPNSGGGRRGQIFGPTFNGIGNDGKVRPMDSSKTNNYPELLGGGDGKPSTRIDGAGIVDPSKNWQLANDGSLPNCTSLGCDENSRYFPYSRQPGDMELIPDPYRVSQQFSSASYSFKTEPTPFLTDFSAFLR